VGQLHHAILEDFVNTLSTRGQGFAQLSDAELLASLRQSCGRLAARLPADATLANARNAYVLRRSAAQLARIVRAQKIVSQSGTARPRAAEVAFGFDHPGSLPAVELSTPQGRRVYLRGFIDRVDIAEVGDELLGIVVDYKRRRDKRLNLGEVYHGLSLQLLGYLLALAKSGETLAGRPVRPIAGLYVSLGAKYHLVDHPKDAQSRDTQLGGAYRPRGLIRADDFGALDQSTETGWSAHFSVYRKKDGGLGQVDSSDAADAGSFDAALDHTHTKLGRLADGILDGHIAVNPYRLGTFSPCSWCAMASVCRFEMGVSDVRFLETLKRSEIFQRLGRPSPG
jgi:ATP-dependent helicase/nuclease subunit B